MVRFSNIIGITALFLVAGCAGSATHDVLSSYQANDENLTCRQIDTEMMKAQLIIDGVNKDKDDWTAADITDGLLWFPFNLIAKDSNYTEALEAGDKRIARLTGLQKEKNCSTTASGSGSSVNVVAPQATGNIGERLRALKEFHRDGLINDEDFQKSKAALLKHL